MVPYNINPSLDPRHKANDFTTKSEGPAQKLTRRAIRFYFAQLRSLYGQDQPSFQVHSYQLTQLPLAFD